MMSNRDERLDRFFDRIEGNGAKFSDDRIYRYALWRVWNPSRPRLLFIMLNPSIANEVVDDPTQRRCRRYTREWGYGGYMAGNIFAYVSTEPKKLKIVGDPIGPENDSYLKRMHADCALTVAAWGRWGNLKGRGRAVLKMLQETKSVMSLGTNGDGTPKHPLYLKADLKPRPIQ